MDENIIKFDLKMKEQKHGIKQKVFNTCRCRQMLADEHLQQLECADCGKILSAWDYILKVCKKEHNLFEHLKYAKIEMRQLHDSLIDIKRQIKNAKSQLKRVKRI